MNTRERLVPTLITVAALLFAALAAAAHLTLGFAAFTSEDARRIRVATAPIPLSPLSVIDAGGASRMLWGGDPNLRVWLVTFVYTRCPSICLTQGSEFQQLQKSLAADERIGLANISFDRAHDSPAELAMFSNRYRADPARWLVGVPDSASALNRLLGEAGVVVIDDGAGGYAHNAAIHVVTASGMLVALFDLDQHREALAFARELAL